MTHSFPIRGASVLESGAGRFAEGLGDVVERATELGLQHRAVEVEGDVAGDVEAELVALALDVEAGAGGAFAQLLFLLVHVIARARARDGADARADDLFGAAVLAADQVAEQIAAERTADAADRGLGNLSLAGHRIGDTAAQHQRADAGEGGELDRLAVHRFAPFFKAVRGSAPPLSTRITDGAATGSKILLNRG